MTSKSKSQELSEYLVATRKRAGLSQQAAIERCSLVTSQKMASRVETNPTEYPLNVVQDYIRAIGASLEEYMKIASKPESLFQGENEMSNSEVEKEVSELLESIDKSVDELKALPEHVQQTALIEKFEQAKKDLQAGSNEPIIGIVGPSDSGKSHITNMVLAQQIAPEGFQPMTAACTLFRHSKLKHPSLGEDENVSVVRYFDGSTTFNLNKLEGDHESFVLDTGDYSILKKFAARDENDSIPFPEAYLAIVYVDAPALENVSLLDTPGQLFDPDYIRKESGEEVDSLDVQKAYEAMHLADGFLYTSSVTKFLRDAGETEFFANILRAPGNAPLDPSNPIQNLTILATQAAGVDSLESFLDGRKRASIHLDRALSHSLYEDLEAAVEGYKRPTAEDWEQRIIPFWDGNKEHVQRFKDRFQELVTNVTENLDAIRQNKTHAIKKQLLAQVDLAQHENNDRKRSADVRLSEVQQMEARFRRDNARVLDKFEDQKASIKAYKNDTIDQVSDVVKQITSESFVTRFIEERFDDKEAAKAGVSVAIGQYFQAKTNRIMNTSSKLFAKETEALVNEFIALVPGTYANVADNEFEFDTNRSATLSSFDGQSAFIGGMSGLAAFGAMGAYVSTITSNLGAYILVGKAGGVLTSLGIIATPTTLPWLVGATGGPLVWGVAISALLGLVVYRLFSSWSKSMARTVVKELKDEGIASKVARDIGAYWDNTEIAFSKAVEGLTTEAEKHIERLYADAKTGFDATELAQVDDTLSNVKTNLKAQ